MEDKSIFRISLLTTTIGILALILLSNHIDETIDYSITNIEDIRYSDLSIKVNGKISSSRVVNGVTIITVEVKENLDIVIFEELYLGDYRIDDLYENITNMRINAKGKLQTNEYGKSIIAEEIKFN